MVSDRRSYPRGRRVDRFLDEAYKGIRQMKSILEQLDDVEKVLDEL